MYRLSTRWGGVVRLIDGATIPDDPGNGDWQAYQEWLAAGNAPDPADPLPVPTYQELRAPLYPDYRDFLDGMVKVHSPDPTIAAEGDAQVRLYCEACLAVKVKYPKV